MKLCNMQPTATIRKFPRLRDIPVGQAAMRLGPTTHAEGSIIMRAAPCDLVAEESHSHYALARQGIIRDPACLPHRDTYVVNLETGRAWFADGNQEVQPIDAEVRYIVTP